MKAPLAYAKVALRNWKPWAKLGVHEVTNPMGFFSRIKLDYPVSLGGYSFAKDSRRADCRAHGAFAHASRDGARPACCLALGSWDLVCHQLSAVRGEGVRRAHAHSGPCWLRREA